MQGDYNENVFPLGTVWNEEEEIAKRKRKEKLMKMDLHVVASEWNQECEDAFELCPRTDFIDKVKKHLETGGTVEIDRTFKSIKLKLCSEYGSSGCSASWGIENWLIIWYFVYI